MFAQCKIARRFEIGVVAIAYALSGALTFPYLGAYFGLLGPSPHWTGYEQLSPFFFLMWHATFPILVVGSHAIGSRWPGLFERRVASLVTWTLVLCATSFTTLAIAFSFAAQDSLPHFILNGVFQPALHAGDALIIILNAVGILVLVSRSRRLGPLEIWLAVVMLGAMLEGLLNESSITRFTYAYDFGKAIAVASALIVICRLTFENIRLYARSLELSDIRSHQSASRMRAIWQITTSDGVSEGDFVQAALEIAVANIRPGKNVFGFVSHLRAGSVVVDAVFFSGDHDAGAASLRAYYPECTFPVESDLHGELEADGRVLAWQRSSELPEQLRCSSVGWHAAIGVAMPVATETHFLITGVLESLGDQPFTDEDSAFVRVAASNISHRFYQRASLERVRFQIEHDTLTGLYNRIQCFRLARSAIASHSLFAIVLIDLDQLRHVNARLGQRGGDELLVEIAAALRAVDPGDAVCRFGGDEFAVVMQTELAERSLEERMQGYQAVFSQGFSTGERDTSAFTNASASLGGVQAERGLKVEELLDCASVALEAAKANAAGSATIYSVAMKSALETLSAQRAELIEAIEGDQLRLEYQPTYDLLSRSIIGAEALIRWQHPTRGMLQPGAFLEAAKRAKVMVPLTAWVIHRIAMDLDNQPLPHEFRCYFNVNATVLEDKAFMAGLERELLMSPLLKDRLGLEVTESEIMSNIEQAIEALKTVRKLGLLVAIDDFGTGHSSLSYLKRLPVDTVKLDRSFIAGLPGDPSDVALAEMFMELTRRFTLVSVAEGIETEEQARWLKNHGCMVGQGFLFSRPVSFDRFMLLLDQSAVESLLRARTPTELA